jgi:hypothetical protein
MGKFILIIFCTVLIPFYALPQWQKKYPLEISIYNNSTLLPGSGYLGFIGHPVHPGLSIGTYITHKTWKRSDLIESFRLGGNYQKYFQLAFDLNTEILFRYHIKHFGLEPQLLIGYRLAKSDLQEFEWDGSTYKRIKFPVKSQFIGGAGLGFSYTFSNNIRVFLAYQFYLQLPFIREYVAILPNTALHLGTSFYLPYHEKAKQK